MTKAKWIAIPALAAALVLGSAAQAGSFKASNDIAAASDFSSKGGKGHAKGHAKAYNKGWHGHYAYKSTRRQQPVFLPARSGQEARLRQRTSLLSRTQKNQARRCRGAPDFCLQY